MQSVFHNTTSKKAEDWHNTTNIIKITHEAQDERNHLAMVLSVNVLI